MSHLTTWWRARTLHSGDAEARLRAVEKLAGSTDRKAVASLIEALFDGDLYVRAKAAMALGELRALQAVEPLVALLLRESEQVVVHAVTDALDRLNSEKAVEALLAALDHPEEAVRQNAASGLRRLGWRDLDDADRVRVAIIQNAWDEAANLGSTAVEHLEAALRKAEADNTRREAAETLARMNAPEALPALLRVLTDPSVDRTEREIAAWALRKCGRHQNLSDAQRAHVAIVEGDWPEVMRLGHTAVEPLRAALSDPILGERERAADALGQIGGAEATEVLVTALGDRRQDITVREASARALGKIADARTIPALTAALRDEGWKVREAAAASLYTLNWTPPTTAERAQLLVIRNFWDNAVELGEAAVEPLVDALKYCEVGAAAARTLAQIHPSGVDALLKVLREHEQPMAVREVVATALAEVGDVRAIEPMVAMLNDRDMVVRQAAVWTLEKLGWEPADDTHRALVAVAHENWDELGALGPAAVEPLLRLAADALAPAETGAALCDVLESSAEDLSVEQLRTMANLRDIHVRHHPAVAENGTQTEPSPLPAVVDCNNVRQLARQELTRRGLLS